MSIKIESETSSFRDNYGHVYRNDNKILRTVNNVAKKECEFIKDNKILTKSKIIKKTKVSESGRIIYEFETL